MHKRFLDFVMGAPKWILILVGSLIIIRMLMPAVGKWVINHQLEQKLGEYNGHIDDFDLSLYRGAYQIQGLKIVKKNSDLPPLIQVDEIDISVAWRSLLHKVITTDIQMKNPVVNLADGKSKEKKQSGLEESPDSWQAVADTIFPVKIESFTIHNGAAYFTHNDLKKLLPVQLEKIEFYTTDLRTQSSGNYSPFTLDALFQGHAKISAEGRADVLARPMKADVDFQLEKFRLNTINQVLLVYLPIDVTKGDLSVYGEAVYGGNASGYAKIFFRDGDIIIKKQDFHSVKHFFIEILGAFANWVLKNNDSRSVAAKIPFALKEGKLDVNASKAFWSAVKNMGDQLPRGIDNTISLKNLGKNTDQTNINSTDEKKSNPKDSDKKKSKDKK